jgi:hypothetical protein
MRVKNIVYEDFVNYKKPSMFIGTISCGGKCCIEAQNPISFSKNDVWRQPPHVEIGEDTLIKRYLENPLTQAIVFGGLEPLEQYGELICFISTLRNKYNCHDDVVIYTGYNKSEINYEIERLKKFDNIVIKFGRFIPDKPHRFSDVLGVELASDNQYAERIS